ncbi:MAG: putative nucleotidyltransferase substrate binding domain-containing protein [Burkholderiaceae bacterium]
MVARFLDQPVLRKLPEPDRSQFAARTWRVSHDAGNPVMSPGQFAENLVFIESGSVRIRDPQADWSLLLEAGAWFGAGMLAADLQANWVAHAESACELVVVGFDAVLELAERHDWLPVYFPALPCGRTRPAWQADTGLNLMATPLRALARRPPVTIAPQATIREAAQRMATEKVSCLMLVRDDRLAGLVTDRDLRNRVLATGLDPGRPVSEIATAAPHTVQAHLPVFEALLLMARHNIHHVPILEGTRIAGMVTVTDLTERHRTSAVFLVGDIHKQDTVTDLVRVSAQVKTLQRHLAAAGTSAYSSGHMITAVTDALTIRLIHLAQEKLGPAPIDYAWVAAGSQARCEQTAKSDQDNCLVLDDAYDETQHGEYFRAFSRFVCDGLDACGYIHCPGEMMAMTDDWRQPRQRWWRYFNQWIDQPEAKALMLTSVFFDLRAVHGNAALLAGLRRDVLAKTRGNSLFLAHMVGNALKNRPPLGLFGALSVPRSGEQAGKLDLKHHGIALIVDLARIYALAGGLDVVNTQERLEQAPAHGELSEKGAHDLRDALEFLSQLRIEHQAGQMARGEAPDNHLPLRNLSGFERGHLKNAFGVVQTLQGVLAQRYQAGRF